MDVVSFVLGALLVGEVAIIGAVAYSVYTFVYKPWKVIRADIVALHARQTNFETEVRTELKARQALFVNDQMMADVETKSRRQRWLRDVESL